MEPFIGKDFLLKSQTAKKLYHEYAAKMPIIDYHCHISPKEIYENKMFQDITEAWLAGDHYKWRQMRMFGIEEKYVTGEGSPFEKFSAYASMLPYAVGNPLYHWTHLELQRYFDCETPLSKSTAEQIWKDCNNKLQNDKTLKVRGIIERSNVTTIVTTDDPIDSLEWHKKIKEDSSFKTKVLPGFRPDKAINITKNGFVDYIKSLEKVAGVSIKTFDDLTNALLKRIEFFHEMGCRASDHGVDEVPVCTKATAKQLDEVLANALNNGHVDENLAASYQVALLEFLGEQYSKLGWVMEIHFGAMRNTNTKGFESLGPDTGYDCIRPKNGMLGLAAVLDSLNLKDMLPKTLIFSLNPNDNAAINTLCTAFCKSGVRGAVQQGSAWWFNDTLDGMKQQMITFASQHLLGTFLGMLTDSRSFLSYTRHEYFRRIFCNILGEWVDNGEYPNDETILKQIVEDVCYNNAMSFFGFN